METDDAQKMTYVIGMAVGGLIVAMGMHAENQDRLSKNQTIAYDAEAFEKLQLDYGLHHNALLGSIRGF